MHPSTIHPQAFPLYAFTYDGDRELEPNLTGPVSLVVGWLEVHVDHDEDLGPITAKLVPILADLNAPDVIAVLDEDYIHSVDLVRVFTDRAEAEREHAHAARMHDLHDIKTTTVELEPA